MQRNLQKRTYILYVRSTVSPFVLRPLPLSFAAWLAWALPARHHFVLLLLSYYSAAATLLAHRGSERHIFRVLVCCDGGTERWAVLSLGIYDEPLIDFETTGFFPQLPWSPHMRSLPSLLLHLLHVPSSLLCCDIIPHCAMEYFDVYLKQDGRCWQFGPFYQYMYHRFLRTYLGMTSRRTSITTSQNIGSVEHVNYFVL